MNMINQSEITTYETKEQAPGVCPADKPAYFEAKQAYLKAKKVYLEAKKIYLEAEKTFSEAKQAYLETTQGSLAVRQAYFEAKHACSEAKHACLKAKKVCSEAKEAYLKICLASEVTGPRTKLPPPEKCGGRRQRPISYGAGRRQGTD